MTASIDKRVLKLTEKMRKLQQTIAELEAKKTPKLTVTSDEIRELAARVKELSADSGENVSMITSLIAKAVGAKTGNRRGASGSVAPKYADPVHPENTWSGRGIAPLWLQRYEAAGRKRDEFLIRNA
jgi:DNA-binding protein H-NS